MKTLYSAFSGEGHGEPRRAGEREARDVRHAVSF
jgi:hypothetical protein